MSTTQQPEALDLADWLDAVGNGGISSTAAASELRRLHAENTTLQAGYAAARLEIESLRGRCAAPAGEYPALPARHYLVGGERKAWDEDDMRAYVDADRAMRAAQPAGAQQPGAAYAALPVTPQFPAHPEPMVMDWSAIEISVIAQYGRDMYEAGKRASHGQPYPTIDDLCARIKAADDAAADRDYMLDSNDCIAILRGEWKGPLAMDKPERPPHGQAPAGATLDVDIDAIALARYKVIPSHESMFHRFAVVAGDGEQQLYLGRETECQNMARKFVGAFLDGAFYQSQAKVPTPSPHAEDTQQAPAQAAPAAVAGSSDDLVTRESAMQAIEHLAISNSPGREDDAIAMLAAAPTTQPAPQQEAQEPVALRPYNPTTEMRWAAKRIDPALTHDQIRALWRAMWSAAPPPSPASQEGALRHYEAALMAAFPQGASGDVFSHWNAARAAQEGK